VTFPAANQSAEVAEPSKVALDFPAPAVATQFAAILSALAVAIVLVARDEPVAVLLPHALIKRIAIASAVADHSFWFGSSETLLDGVREPPERQVMTGPKAVSRSQGLSPSIRQRIRCSNPARYFPFVSNLLAEGQEDDSNSARPN
jgi:hypothetical protein